MKYKLSKKGKADPIAPLCRKEAYFTLEDAQAMIKHIGETRVTKKIRAYSAMYAVSGILPAGGRSRTQEADGLPLPYLKQSGIQVSFYKTKSPAAIMQPGLFVLSVRINYG